MTTKPKYYSPKSIEQFRIGKGLLLALPLSIAAWIIILATIL